MAFDQELSDRIESVLRRRHGLTSRKMFGGIAFMLNGNMCCGVIRDELILRLGPEGGEEALEREFTRPFDFTGRPMRGFVVVEPEGFESPKDLKVWLQQAAKFASSLPPK